jgi:hypothetical protein
MQFASYLKILKWKFAKYLPQLDFGVINCRKKELQNSEGGRNNRDNQTWRIKAQRLILKEGMKN